ncbi:hypothetical protein MCOR27_004338 [Pyricularia oryzae]|uniref:Uncharacterized protein n=5 Tax=Pyricularia TaxID=48558 RepID=A0ABQ8NFD9_PYRGI|nr:uncharacterized protein MGG_04112 [Pyricularia oryzae 70-15]ELQ41757.1 hypothetical protein OOU_Y34scaffold00255g55 [Pyricularia oryzae Y34]KAH8845857.1 hypothetical protein MCOR01_003080 [Pyricularia oryzae]KAI6296167.1 hypothetical protein MCOR33_007140 [Pyricularia grisea]EHA47352.1 hypothetical protein MGG_04112 [Pyricularia oryzae 70-15]KAH9432636.1 hypothetical protein MCOR02_007326 [Pyricularia oryzae]
MATSRSMSPGGALLRSSRMFSLPPPVPAQVNNIVNSSVNRSDSATLPYPTHQSITTPSAARRQGDWGFKRPFPLKSTTKSTTPLIRVKAVDTIEHVTDFASSADHTLSLEKFQEMNIPVVMPPFYDPSNPSSQVPESMPRKSVFEESHDITDIAPEKKHTMSAYRWHFDGPWLAGMSEGEFNKYLQAKVKPRRAEFRQWLKGIVAEEMNQRAIAESMDKGDGGEHVQLTAADVTDEHLTNRLRELRADRVDLYKLVGRFLDLAPIAPKRVPIPEVPGDMRFNLSKPAPMNPYAEAGPPVTHPSAGISYLRTGSFVENHPLYGPQQSRRHVAGRVLLSNSSFGQSMGTNVNVNIGLGGFVTKPPTGDSFWNNKTARNRFDPAQRGGEKQYVEPLLAVVDSRGNVRVTAKASHPEGVAVAKELDGVRVGGKQAEPESSFAPAQSRKTGNELYGDSGSYGFKA